MESLRDDIIIVSTAGKLTYTNGSPQIPDSAIAPQAKPPLIQGSVAAYWRHVANGATSSAKDATGLRDDGDCELLHYFELIYRKHLNIKDVNINPEGGISLI